MPSRELPPDWSPGSCWAVPAFLEYVQPALTPEAISEAEAQLGVRLPGAYLAVLRHQNGGYARGVHDVACRIYGIGPRYPSITLDGAWWRPKNANPKAWAPERPDLLIPFDGDGHWDMCFDYRTVGPRGEPSITFVDCEGEREEAIAIDFLEYLVGLVDDTTIGAVRIYGDVGAEQVARRIAERLGAPEPTVDTWSHGYATWRVALPLGTSQWCWCTPNRVPAGFRREGNTVVVTAETALRIPEDPDCAVLVSATDECVTAVSAVVAALGWATR